MRSGTGRTSWPSSWACSTSAAFAGGVRAAFRSYETDYWLTCYKESIERLRSGEVKGPALFVLRQLAIAREYASGMWDVQPFEPDDGRTTPGSLILLTTRSNIDQKVHPNDPVVLSVGRLGATFCVVKQVPDSRSPPNLEPGRYPLSAPRALACIRQESGKPPGSLRADGGASLFSP